MVHYYSTGRTQYAFFNAKAFCTVHSKYDVLGNPFFPYSCPLYLRPLPIPPLFTACIYADYLSVGCGHSRPEFTHYLQQTRPHCRSVLILSEPHWTCIRPCIHLGSKSVNLFSLTLDYFMNRAVRVKIPINSSAGYPLILVPKACILPDVAGCSHLKHTNLIRDGHNFL